MVILAGCCTLLVQLGRLRQPAATVTVLDWALGALYLAIGYAFLSLYGYEGDWYRLDQMLGWTGAPPFQHRVLFLWLAHVLLWAAPGTTILTAYLATQVVALALALIAVRLFATLFIRRDLAFTAQFLALAIWAPTVSYYTFYDVGIIAVYAAALYLLFHARFALYLAVFAVGTYNHEITLFLVVASLFGLRRRMPLPKLAALLAAQLVLYVLVRWSLFYFLPTHAAWEGGKLAKNVAMLLHTPARVVASLGPLLIWYAIALTGWSQASAMLRRVTIILPCLLLMTFVVGQLNEARQFDAFIPVTVALLCCRIQAMTARVIPNRASAAAAPLDGLPTPHA